MDCQFARTSLAFASAKTHDQLDIDERYEIYRLRETGVCLREIGRMMGRSASTISRELAGQADYGRPQLNPAKPEPTRWVRHGFVWAVGFFEARG